MTTPHLHNTASPTSGRKPAAGGGWLAAVRRYLAVIAVGNLLWEFAQLPLYTIWYEGSMEEILFAVVHCTGGDVLIASMTLLGALILAGDPRWPQSRFHPVPALAILGGLASPIFTGCHHPHIRGSGAYPEAHVGRTSSRENGWRNG